MRLGGTGRTALKCAAAACASQAAPRRRVRDLGADRRRPGQSPGRLCPELTPINWSHFNPPPAGGPPPFTGPSLLPPTRMLELVSASKRVPTSPSKLDSFSKPQNPPKIVQKAPKTAPKTLPKRVPNSILSCNARNPEKMQPSYTKTSFLTFTGLQKSSQNRCQNAFKIGIILDN